MGVDRLEFLEEVFPKKRISNNIVAIQRMLTSSIGETSPTASLANTALQPQQRVVVSKSKKPGYFLTSIYPVY